MSDVIPSDGDAPNPSDDGSPEGHVEKMLAMSEPKGDETSEPEGDSQVTARPDNVPEKFWNAEKGEINTEALLKSQADAETALRSKDEPKPEGDDDSTGDTPEVSASQQGTVDDASAEWAENGSLSEATFEKLEKVGLSKDMVNSYIAGQQAIVSNLQEAAYGPFEGAEGYGEATQWAADNLSDAEIQAFDVQLTSMNPAIVAQGSKALQERYNSERDIEPNSIRGDSNGSTAGDSYGSSREMMKDMNSREYRTSAAFRDKVAAKLGRSNL